MTAVSENDVYAHVWEGDIYKSTDAGSTYSDITKYPFDGAYDICFLDSLNGNAAGGLLHSTNDGGSTWSSKDVCRFGCSSVVFVDTLYGWTSGSKALHRTTDGGLTWQDQTSFIDTRPEPANWWKATHLAAIDSNNAIFGGEYGLWVTFNGGAGTTSSTPPNTYPVASSIQIAPNPASDHITVTLDSRLQGRLTIVDLAGRIVYERHVVRTDANDHVTHVSTSHLAKGVYQVLFHGTESVIGQILIVAD
jgi:photosystem II stability/assembly factor-like uncharacterized protein